MLKNSFLFFFVLLIVTGCNKDDDNRSVSLLTPPSTGRYVDFQYDSLEVTTIVNVPYSTRPNYENLQFTDANTRTAEQQMATLTMRSDIYLPPNAAPSSLQPLIIMIHGGGFAGGSKAELSLKALSYARAGYVAASINYRLTPDNELNAVLRVRATYNAIEDAMNAVRFFKLNADVYHIDTTRIALIGVSAGGGISLGIAIGAEEFSDLISDYSDISSRVSACVSTGATLSNDTLLLYAPFQPDPSDSPVMMFHNSVEDTNTTATWGQAMETQAYIESGGVECVLVPTPPDTHTVNLALGGSYWPDLLPFLWRNLRLYELR